MEKQQTIGCLNGIDYRLNIAQIIISNNIQDPSSDNRLSYSLEYSLSVVQSEA